MRIVCAQQLEYSMDYSHWLRKRQKGPTFVVYTLTCCFKIIYNVLYYNWMLIKPKYLLVRIFKCSIKLFLWDFNTLDKWSSIHTHYGVTFYETDILCMLEFIHLKMYIVFEKTGLWNTSLLRRPLSLFFIILRNSLKLNTFWKGEKTIEILPFPTYVVNI